LLVQRQVEIYERKFGEIPISRSTSEDPFGEGENGGKVH